MAQKHLRELLLEDQEPFFLKEYISDRRGEIKKPCSRTHLQVKKRKPISQNSTFPPNFCKKSCFFSHPESPDPRKSPLFGFRSPAKSANAVFLHIPNRTAALLLEAALRIQKQSSSNHSKPKTGSGFGLFGTILKRLTNRSRTRKREIGADGVGVSVKDILRWESPVAPRRFSHKIRRTEWKNVHLEKSDNELNRLETRFPGRPSSSAIWSESNEDKSFDCGLGTSSSGSSSRSEYLDETLDDADFSAYGSNFCESPFHFVLHTSPSPGHRTPNFQSPAASPSRHRPEEKEKYEVDSLKRLQVEEEEKEQCSPVSVLDSPFEDDDVGHVEEEEDEKHQCLEASYVNVQRAKHQLLQKLRRFEQLAGLDPVELEQRISGQEDEDDSSSETRTAEEQTYFSDSLYAEETEFEYYYIEESPRTESDALITHIPECMKRLVSDLIEEEEADFAERDTVVKRVCKRLDSWNEVESNTIDMMVEQDFRNVVGGWKKHEEELLEVATEIELSIFRYLVEEL